MSARSKASLGFIFTTVLIDVIGLGIIIPVVPSLIEKLIDGGISEASKYGGWLMFSYAIMQFFFAPVLGELSDRLGRRPVLLVALFGLGLDYIFHAYAPSIIWLFVGRIIAGICGASYTVANAYIADISTPDKKAQNFGLIGAAFGVGFIIGPVIGGIASKWGVQMPFMVAAALTFLNFTFGYFILPESLPKEKRRSFNIKRANPIGSLLHLNQRSNIIGLIISIFLLNIAAHALQSTWTYYTMFKFNWDEAMVGYSLGIVGLLIAIVQGGLIKPIVNRFGEYKTIIVSFLLWTTGMLLLGLANRSWMLFIFIIPYCLGGVGGPTLQGIISNKVPDNEQGELQGAITSLLGLTAIIGPLMMTNLFYYFTAANAPLFLPGIPFYTGAALIVIGMWFAIRSLNNKDNVARGS